MADQEEKMLALFHQLATDELLAANFELHTTGRIILLRNADFLIYVDERYLKVSKRKWGLLGRSRRIVFDCYCREFDTLCPVLFRVTDVLLARGGEPVGAFSRNENKTIELRGI